jgi:hypothetical protein
VIDPIAAQLVEAITADETVPYLQTPVYQAAVWAWARAEARVMTLTEWLANQRPAEVNEDGSIPAALTALERWEKIAANARSRLGLDPLSRARLGKDLATTKQADAAAALTQMREDFERQQHTQGGPDGR